MKVGPSCDVLTFLRDGNIGVLGKREGLHFLSTSDGSTLEKPGVSGLGIAFPSYIFCLGYRLLQAF